MYRELDTLTDNDALNVYKTHLIDRFGEPPVVAEELLKVMPLKWIASELGIEKITLKGHNMIIYFINDFNSPYYQSDTFMRFINYASKHPRQAQLRESQKRSLHIKGISCMSDALNIMETIKDTPVC